MIDITAGEPRIIRIRYTCFKEFDIDVTINDETHNLGITGIGYELSKTYKDRYILKLHKEEVK